LNGKGTMGSSKRESLEEELMYQGMEEGYAEE
jgi:hypothetical protein